MAPISAFRTSPRPPNRLVPPMTAAAIASISSVLPPAFRSTLLEARGEDDPAEPGHEAGDHEDEDADRGTLIQPGARPPRSRRPRRRAGRRSSAWRRRSTRRGSRRRAGARTARPGPCSDADRHEGDHRGDRQPETSISGSRIGIPWRRCESSGEHPSDVRDADDDADDPAGAVAEEVARRRC